MHDFSTFPCTFLVRSSQYYLPTIRPHAALQALQKKPSKFCPTPPHIQNSARMLKFFHLLHYQTVHFPSPYLFSLLNALPCLQPTFTSRTSGHGLEDIYLSTVTTNKSPLITPHCLFLPYQKVKQVYEVFKHRYKLKFICLRATSLSYDVAHRAVRS
jgi:hypothetical protein